MACGCYAAFGGALSPNFHCSRSSELSLRPLRHGGGVGFWNVFGRDQAAASSMARFTPHCGHGHAQHLSRPTAHKAGRHVSGTLVGTVLEHCIAGLNGVAAVFFSVTMCCWQTFGQEALEGTSEAVGPSFWKPSFFLPSSAGGTSGQDSPVARRNSCSASCRSGRA